MHLAVIYIGVRKLLIVYANAIISLAALLVISKGILNEFPNIV